MLSPPTSTRDYNPYWVFYDPCPEIEPLIISNKQPLTPSGYKPEPEYTMAGWYHGYSFKHFWSNCHALLGEIGKLDGIQQLCHQYYLQNGSLGAKVTAERIRRLLCT